MRTFRTETLGAASGALALTLGMASFGRTAEEQKPVPAMIVNTPAAAVPVAPQGTTQVAGTVTIANSPSVSLVGTPTVRVESDASAPVVVRNAAEPARAAFHWTFAPFLNTNESARWDDYTVPGGKILVIEHASLHLISQQGPPVPSALVRLGYVIPSEVDSPDWLLRSPIYLPFALTGSTGENSYSYIGNQPLRAYVMPGDTVRVILTVSQTGTTILARVTLTGYFVDAAS